MRDIFAESGLSAGAVYNHFPSKDRLLEHLARESERKWQVLFSELQGRQELRPRDRLELLVHDMIDGLGDSEVVREVAADFGMWAFAIHKDPLRKACRQVFRTIAEGFECMLEGKDDSDCGKENRSGTGGGQHILAHLLGLGLQASLGLSLDLEREKQLASVLIENWIQEIS
jgi:AcrR family transcriptional regulator